MSESQVAPPTGGGDGLSALPDALLHSVMSNLTSRQAVQTCALSRRWRDLWRSAPCVDIVSAAADGEQHPPAIRRREGWERLESFATNLLMCHSAPTTALDRFRLSLGLEPGAIFRYEYDADERHGSVLGRCAAKHVDRWIRWGITSRPAEISVELSPELQIKLPPLGPSASRRLRTLRLAGVRLDRGFADSLRSGCPVLDALEIRNCVCEFQEIVVSGTLKSLAMDCGMGLNLEEEQQQPRRRVRVVAPGLASLCLFVGWSPYRDGIFLDGADSLVRASVAAGEGCKFEPMSTQSLREIFAKLVNVRALKLSRFLEVETLFVDDERHGDFSKFHKLTTLDLEECDMNAVFRVLPGILQSAPCLEKVTLQHCKFPRGSKRKRGPIEPKMIAFKYRSRLSISQSQDLKTIHVRCKKDDICELIELLRSIGRRLHESTIIVTKI
ncbi:unnamed protein product [Urochloa decumbens]|uniref:F-box domain-containing protein n=1 Tax=Urochloa decumbens TaxID=240449 RepID=A0ABC9F317_9POAL